VFLDPLATVTTTHFKLAELNGTWQYVGGQQIQLSFNGPAKITIPVRKYEDSAQNTSMTTTVSG
jgi:hypothetical protein